MDDFIFRAKTTYVILTVALCFMSLAMIQAGADSPFNTAWVLIVWLRNALLGLGAIGLIIWLVGTRIAAQDECCEQPNEREKSHKIERAQFKTSITALEAPRSSTPLTKNDNLITETKSLQAIRTEENQAQLEILRKSSRSTVEAAKEALDEFL